MVLYHVQEWYLDVQPSVVQYDTFRQVAPVRGIVKTIFVVSFKVSTCKRTRNNVLQRHHR